MKKDVNYYALQLCFLLAVVFGIQYFFGFEPGFNASNSPVWKFFTSVFGHSDLQHLLNNLFFIGVFGTMFELFTDSRTFLLTFVGSALFANLSAFIFFPATTIIGASGGAIGVLAALAVYRPNEIGLALGVPAPMWAVLAVYILINVAGLSASNSVAYEAHLMGMMVGAVVGYRLREPPEERSEEENDLDNWQERIRKWEEKWMV